MKTYQIEREFVCELVDSGYPQHCKAIYDVKELDDGFVQMELVYGSLQILDAKEGNC